MSEKQTVEVKKPEAKKPFTNWVSFIKGNFVPKQITCQAYRQMQPADISCHTRLPLDVTNMLRHIDPCGGGFTFVLRQGETAWEGWQDLMERGMELHDFRCDWCEKVVPLSAQQIQRHMRPHVGKNRRTGSASTFLLTLSPNKPVFSDDDID